MASSKSCSVCRRLKDADQYNRDRRARDGRQSRCRQCEADYYVANADRVAARVRHHRQMNRDEINKRRRDRRAENPEEQRKIERVRYAKNPGKARDRSKAYAAANRGRVSAYHKEWRLSSPANIIRYRVSPQIRRGLTTKKETGVFRHLPYSLDELTTRLAETMPAGYTWDDLADLHIDHIRPVSSFDIQHVGDEQFMACWSLSNLQLLPAAENLRKGASLEWNGVIQ